MTISKRFFRFAAICAAITALTTIVVHAVPNLYDAYDTFEERLELRNHWIYITRFWIVLLHCALVVVSMYAVGIRKLSKAPVLAPLGFLCFVIFAFTEWLRTSIAIFGLNRTWRSNFASASEATARQFLENYINAFNGFNDALFFIFFTCFLAGCACYGFAYCEKSGWDRKISLIFLIWTAIGIPAWLDEIFRTDFASYLGSYTWLFQCAARAIIGFWLWSTATSLHFHASSTNKTETI